MTNPKDSPPPASVWITPGDSNWWPTKAHDDDIEYVPRADLDAKVAEKEHYKALADKRKAVLIEARQAFKDARFAPAVDGSCVKDSIAEYVKVLLKHAASLESQLAAKDDELENLKLNSRIGLAGQQYLDMTVAQIKDEGRAEGIEAAIEIARESVKKSQTAKLDTAAAEILIWRLESAKSKGGES